MEKEFRVGDKVKAIRKVGNDNKVNVKGKIIYDDGSAYQRYLVEFEKHINGHDGDGIGGVRGKKGHCWWCAAEDIELANKTNKLIIRDNTTILIKDGKKYISKCCEGDTFDKEKGLLMCLAKANGVTYNDLKEMLDGAEYQNKTINYPHNVPIEIIKEALRIIRGNGIDFYTKAEVKEFYELIKDNFPIRNFNNDYSCYPRYFAYDRDYCDWYRGYVRTYTYKQLKAKILELLGKKNINKVREVKRRAKVGEYVRVVENKTHHEFSIGEIVKCSELCWDEHDKFIDLKESNDWYMRAKEYIVLENYKPKK